MAEHLNSENNCTLAQCMKCENREESPLCSVHGADEEVRRSRSEVKFKAGQTIFYEGNAPIGLYVIQTGLVKLQSTSAEGSTNTLRLLNAGQALGYRSLFANETYRASAICVEDTTLCFLPKNILSEIVSNYPQVAMNLLQQLAKDLRTAEDKWITQVNKGAPERVAEAVLFLDEHFHDQPWTRREIAQWAGTTPETVMRNLSQFEKDGLISSQGRAYKILDRRKLLEKSQET
jgi:CRP-like cAMP-binding protein